ncbi:RHS repeat-associated core domain-containing protein [Actinomycetes bacterium KLBMP 9797]
MATLRLPGRRTAALSTIATLVVAAVSVDPVGAGPPLVPPAARPGPALTSDRAPAAVPAGKARTTPGIGGASSDRPWTPSARAGTAAGTGAAIQTEPDLPAPGAGVQDFYAMERRQLADRLQLLTNTANGNVVVRYQNLTVSAIGVSTDVSHVYNNLSTRTGAFGRGWTMSTGRDVGLEIETSRVLLYGPTGFRTTFTRNSDGSYKAGSGINARLTKESDGTWSLRWNKSEDVWTFHSTGVLHTMRNKNNIAIRLNYDAAHDDRLAAIYDPNGRVTTMSEYDASNRVVRLTDWTGSVHGPFRYDTGGNLTSFDDRLGHPISFGYDGNGNLTSIVDPRGNTWTMTYDAQRRVTSIAEPNGTTPAITRYAYPEARRTTVTDPRGNAATYHFDDAGRQTKAIDQLGHEQSKTWTVNSDVAATTSPLGASVTYAFDALNNATGAALPTGARSVVGYTDAVHPYFPTSVRDPQGNELRQVYDATGNLVSIRSVDLARDLFRYEHNHKGQVTKVTDGAGRVTTYLYDGGSRRTVERPPGGRQERVISYDDRDRVVETFDGNRNKVSYRYDVMDRLVEIGQTVAGVYTPLQYNNFDASGNLVGRYFGDSGVQLRYNPRNQVVEARNIRGAVRYDTHYTYDANLNLTDIEDPGGRIKYTYDKANRLTFQSGPREGLWAIFEYDNDDRRIRTRFPGEFRVRTTYDAAGRPTALIAERPDGTRLLDRGYRWDGAAGDTMLLQSETREGQTISYRYDDQNQLLTQGPLSYTLDSASNLTSAEGRHFTINAAGQVDVSQGVTYTHDGAGNLTHGSGGELTGGYSSTNQLTSLASRNAPTIGFTYDTVDQSQRAVIRTGTTEQLLNNTAIGVTGVTTNGQRSMFARDSAGTLVGQVTGAGEILYAVTDYQGSTLMLVDTNHQEAARYTYTPYGTTTATGRAADGNPFRWIGAFQLKDAHGTYAVGHRQHDPLLARFTQPDPSQQEPNPYTYALANPITFVDPTGLATWVEIAGIGVITLAAAAIGAVIGFGLGGPIGAAIGATAAGGCVSSGLWAHVDGGSLGQGCLYGAGLGLVTTAGGAISSILG